MYDILIFGAGTAGLTAAIYGVRAGRSVAVLEESVYGGQIINTLEIENYPGIKKVSGVDYATGLFEQATALGAQVLFDAPVSVEKSDVFTVTTKRGKTLEAKSLILAVGAKNRPLGVEGEEKFTGRGISYCATCDGAFFRGKDVAVVGGGNTAIDDALFLTDYCNKVYLIHRRQGFRAEEAKLALLKDKQNLEFVLDSVVETVEGEETFSGVTVKNKESGAVRHIAVDGLFVAVGQVPATAIAKDLVALDDYGYIVAGEDCKTSTEGIFAAGDCRTKQIRQLVTAAADGAIAALAACEYIRK